VTNEPDQSVQQLLHAAVAASDLAPIGAWSPLGRSSVPRCTRCVILGGVLTEPWGRQLTDQQHPPWRQGPHRYLSC
jgi:hypothetical protein